MVKVGSGVITSRELIVDTLAVKRFYTSQDFASVGLRVDFDTDEGKLRLKIKEKDVLDKLIEDEIIRTLAQEKGIKVDQQDADREINRKINQLGNRQALEASLQKLYGWDVDEFRDKVVTGQMYLQKLSERYFEEHKSDNAAYEKIRQAKKELKADGSNLGEIAKKYSEGESAQNGGELGWFQEEQLVPEVADAVFLAKPGTITDVIQSSLGYHIVMVEEFREVENQAMSSNVLGNQGGKAKEVKIKQIFVKGGGFLDWLDEEKRKADVSVWMKDYVWDSGEGALKFRNQQLNAAEQRLRTQSDGDPSMQPLDF